MKSIIITCIFALGILIRPAAQNKIEIHQIDVGTGDAALINVMYNTGDSIQYSILIDAGETNMNAEVISYLQDSAKHAGGKVYLDYVIASHYHSDHIGGFVGQKTTSIVSGAKKRRCDPFYSGVLGYSSKVAFYAVLDKGVSAPSSSSDVYKNYVKLAGNRRVAVGTSTVGSSIFAVNSITPPGTYPPPTPFLQGLSLGGYIDLGADANGVPVRLRLILADAKVYYPGKPGNTYNIPDTVLNKLKYNLRTKRTNDNNWGLGWVLEYGAFKWYTAGDVGGYDASYLTCTSCGSAYFDIETTMSNAFPQIYPNPVNAKGHICVQKVSHHGSCCSSNQQFLDTLRSSFAVISCGTKHDHPTQEVINRLEQTRWHTDSILHDSTYFYLMTELYYYNRNINLAIGNTAGSSQLVASGAPVNPAGILATYPMTNGGNIYKFSDPPVPPIAGGVVIKIAPVNNGIPITSRSIYTIYYDWYNGNPLTKTVNCHGQ